MIIEFILKHFAFICLGFAALTFLNYLCFGWDVDMSMTVMLYWVFISIYYERIRQ